MTTIISKEKPLQIGDIIFTDDFKIGSANALLNRVVLPKMKTLIDLYNQLGLPTFSQKLWSAIVDARGAEPIETLYAKATEKELSSIPLLKTSQNVAIAEQMKVIAAAYKDAFEATFTNSDPEQLPFQLSVVCIGKDGLPYINKQPIIERFSTRIENENQLKFYQLASQMVKVNKEMQALLIDSNLWSQSNWISDLQTHGIFDLTASDTLEVNAHFIAVIR